MRFNSDSDSVDADGEQKTDNTAYVKKKEGKNL